MHFVRSKDQIPVHSSSINLSLDLVCIDQVSSFYDIGKWVFQKSCILESSKDEIPVHSSSFNLSWDLVCIYQVSSFYEILGSEFFRNHAF